ncbi:malonate decarboxylase subunit epsilon [Bacillus sp. FJAT-45350]|uniref:malonate decarboxylase subunit epsilon n=1 Tax=Bacillus sp. FJAT-45350 TaxID=2011014 RepID=UPI000BB6CF83|nr:malonate decarboxylase subunit epsilon [Bacillus sp. FJAT-45350]
MKLAFLFPGQGAQKPNFLNELPPSSVLEDVMTEVNETLDENIYTLDTEEALSSTRAVQLTLLTAGIATYRAFEEVGVTPGFVAGHSIGAFGAAVAAGVITFKDAVKIVNLRGQLMEQPYPEGYGMGVVNGIEANRIQALITKYYDEKYPIFMSNRNAPNQITISGALPGIQKVLDDVSLNGARSAALLNVSTPSHCPLLSSVTERLKEALNEIPLYRPSIPYAGNRRARLLSDPVDIRLDLAESVSAPVQWHDASTVLYEKGVRLFIEMPPGNVLSRLATNAFPEARALSVTDNGFEDCHYVVSTKNW